MKTILIVSQYFYPERFLLNDLVKTLLEKGHKVIVLTGQPNYPDGHIFKDYSNFSRFNDKYLGAQVLRVPVYPRGKGRAWELALNYLSFIVSCLIFGVPRVLFKKFDVIFSWGTSPILQSIPALIIKLFKRKKTYLWVQDLWPETLTSLNMIRSQFLISIVGFVVKFIYVFTDYILVQSPGFKKSVIKYGGKESKIHWLPNWSMAPSEVKKETFPRPKFDKSYFNILFAGNLGKAQSLQTILDTASMLLEQTHIKIHLLGEGSEKSWAQKVCQEKNINNISFLQGCSTEEVPYYFSNCQALLVTLIDDEHISLVIPSKIQTYLAAGRPILAAVNGEAYKVLLDSGASLASPAEEPAQLAKNIKELASYPDNKLEEMALNGKKYYQQYFDRNKVINNLITLFEKGMR